MKYKTYIIEDKVFNAIDLGKELGVSQQTARNRLKVAKTVNDLYYPLHSKVYKKHVIEGKIFTSDQLAKKLNCSASTARARLTRSKTIDELLKPIHSNKGRSGKKVNCNVDTPELQMRKLMLGAW